MREAIQRIAWGLRAALGRESRVRSKATVSVSFKGLGETLPLVSVHVGPAYVLGLRGEENVPSFHHRTSTSKFSLFQRDVRFSSNSPKEDNITSSLWTRVVHQV